MRIFNICAGINVCVRLDARWREHSHVKKVPKSKEVTGVQWRCRPNNLYI